MKQDQQLALLLAGVFKHTAWPLRCDLEGHQSMRAVMEYETNYINAAGYWMGFHESNISLPEESLKGDDESNANKYDVWALL